MPSLPEEDRRALLKVARSAIASALCKDRQVERPGSVSPALLEKRGCFVTLHQRGNLRGCIGTIEPVRPLIESVEENAMSSAFKDPRFSPLSAGEVDQVEIEISVLSVPRPLPFKDGQDLKAKLRPGVHGVIVSKGWRGATFLPQVWEQLPDMESFLSHLCLKAGMSRDAWKNPETQVKVYEAEYFSEKEY